MAWVGWGVPVVVIGVVVFCFLLLLVWIRAPKATKIPIKGRHMVITGGSSGIGLELAKLAAAEGARISLVARDPVKLADAQKAVAEYVGQHNKSGGTPVKVNVYSADVKSFASINKAIEAAVSESGIVELLVLSHGVSVPGTFEERSLEEMDHMIDTNLRGNIHAIKAALPHIKSSKGAPASIAIFSSQAGQTGVYGYATYAASKFALRGLAESLQQELIERNIRVSIVFPPDTDTPGYAEELKFMPELTKKLSESSKAMDAVSVAHKALAGVKAGYFNISCNFDGFMLNIVNAGMSPQPSFLVALAEILAMGPMRIVAFFVLRGWYDTIHSSQKHLQTKK